MTWRDDNDDGNHDDANDAIANNVGTTLISHKIDIVCAQLIWQMCRRVGEKRDDMNLWT